MSFSNIIYITKHKFLSGVYLSRGLSCDGGL